MDRAGTKTKASGFNLDFAITRQEITDTALAALGFFIGRVIVFDTINPIGIAYIAPFFMKGRTFFISCFFMSLGILTRYNHFYSLKYFICMGVLALIQFLFSKKVTRIGEYIQAVIVASVLLTSGIVVAIINNGSFYLGVVALLEGVLTFTFSVIIGHAMICIKGKNRLLQKTLTNEELISVAVLVAAIIAGGGDIFIWEFSFRYFFCFIIVMLMANGGGSAMGSASGLLLGSLIHISGYEPISYIIILSMAGLICGSLRSINKFAALAGFIIGGVITSFYFTYEIFEMEYLVSLIFSATAFILLKSEFIVRLPVITNPVANSQNEQYSVKSRSIISHRLSAYSAAFDKLSRSFKQLSARKTGLSKQDVSNIIDDTAARVCAECEHSQQCWFNNFYYTYQIVYNMLSVCETKGKLTESDIPDEFTEICANVTYFAATINRYFELYKANLIWRNKIAESRKLISEQIEGVADIFGSLSQELEKELDFLEEYEKAILLELDKNKIEVHNVIVLQNMQGLYEVTINRKTCCSKEKNQKKTCDKKIMPIVSRVLGKKMKREDKFEKCSAMAGKSVCSLHLIEEQRYMVVCGVSNSSKDNDKSVSGDSYSIMEYRNGQCMLALSDGMGSGACAKDESTTAIELLEEFMESGFEKDIAVKLINSILLLKSGDESFSTLDICSICLHTGNAEFVKIGASSTFLLRNGDVDVIRSWSLPVGIVDTVDVDISKRKLKDNDIIIMVTDGILDSDTYESEKENWIIKALANFNGKNPQDIADYVLSEAKKNYGASQKDDMTVLVAKIWEKL